MNLRDALYTRRSVRKYTAAQVEKETVERLLDAAVQAPSASNIQPWAFAVIQDKELLAKYSDQTKRQILAVADQTPRLAAYKGMLSAPGYNIFYNAGTLIIIYAADGGPYAHGDCCLAAQNLMLAAHDMGLGTCWIGFAHYLLNDPAIKKELGVPEEYTAVAPLILGYPDGALPAREKKAPKIIFWR